MDRIRKNCKSKNSKRWIAGVMIAALAVAQISGCGQKNRKEEAAAQEAAGAKSVQPVTPVSRLNVSYTEEDLSDVWDMDSAAAVIAAAGDKADIRGTGAAFEDGVLTISQPGVYVLSGSLEDGQVRIEAGREDLVQLVLNGISIENTRTSAICAVQCKKLILTLAQGSENRIQDAEVYGEGGEDGPAAALYSKDDLTINGAGSLSVYGNYRHGIHGKDDLKILSGSVYVQAAEDGIKGKDSVAVKDADLTVEAGGDGIRSDNDTDAEKGYILLQDGSFQVAAGRRFWQSEGTEGWNPPADPGRKSVRGQPGGRAPF